ncbi:MAG: SGNH/GDSL hydrolase family protein [Acidobacteriia bacterium]|nr:SGNH/GDSL hydrolase family protein [Terriglobia bacterium]
MRLALAALLLAASLLLAAPANGQSNYYLKNGDRVVFYGDSITDQMLYTGFVETYTLTRFPRLNVTFVHSGWGGDRVTGGGGGPIDLRLRRDVFAHKPTVMTIMLGMNDAGYKAFDEGLYKTYTTGYEHIIDSVKKELPGIRITVIEASPFDDVTHPPSFEGGYNAVLVRYAQFAKELGERDGLAVADANTAFVEALQKANRTDPETAKRIIPDRVHPAVGGALLLAEGLLKAWNAPATVTAVEIDAAGKRVVSAENSKVTGLEAANGLAWSQLDVTLPMPLDLKDPVLALAVRSSDIEQALDEEPLKVTGLAAARYTLKIDGEEVGTFTKEQLAEGINLALLPTPMAKQAASVHALTGKRTQVHWARWRMLQVPLADDHFAREQAALDALDRLDREIAARQHSAAQPKSHHYELIPQ